MRLAIILLLVALVQGADLEASSSSSSRYSLQHAASSSGANHQSSDRYKMPYQSVSPVFTGVSDGQDQKAISGAHFSSKVFDIKGISFPVERGMIPLDIKENGLITTRVELAALMDGVTVNSAVIDGNQFRGWMFDWESLDVTYNPTVVVKSRAFDGLSWGAWYHTDTFQIDNVPPSFNTLAAQGTGGALNSGLGTLSASFPYEDNRPDVSSTLFFKRVQVNPTAIPGLLSWLDASDAGSVIRDEGGAVSRLLDKSGLGNHAAQTVRSQQPEFRVTTGNLPYVLFDGDDGLDFSDSVSLTGDHTIIIVAKARSESPAVHRLIQARSVDWFMGYDDGMMVMHRSDGDIYFGDGIAEGYHIFVAHRSINGLMFLVDGDTVNLSPYDEFPGRLSLGATGFSSDSFDGLLGEVLVYNQALSPTHLGELLHYLDLKWNVSPARSPASIPGVQLWLDASDVDAFRFGDQQEILTWYDKSNARNHLVQTRSEARPQRVATMDQKFGVYFDGVKSLSNSDITLPQERSVYLVSLMERPLSVSHGATQFNMDFGNGNPYLLRLGGQGAQAQLFGLPSSIPYPFIQAAHLSNDSIGVGYTKSPDQLDDAGYFVVDFYDLNPELSVDDDVAGPFVVGSTDVNLPSRGYLFELVVVDRELSLRESKGLRKYFVEKWMSQFDSSWTQASLGNGASSWENSSQSDNALYQVRVAVKDRAGNVVSHHSQTVRTPDRTPPTIGRFVEGTGVVPLSLVSGIEDENIELDLSTYKSDPFSSAETLVWQADLYSDRHEDILLQDAYKNAHPIIQRIQFSGDDMVLHVSPNANTGQELDRPILPGNRFGKQAAYMRLLLRDAAGNTATQDVRIHVQAVNDAPYLTSTIIATGNLGSYFDPNRDRFIYHLRTNEDTLSQAITLDHYIEDVDDLLSDLTIVVSENAILQQQGDIPFNNELHSVFAADGYTFRITNEATGHRLTVEPTGNFYGDLSLTLNISDNKSPTSFVSQPFVVRVFPVNDAPTILSDIPIVYQADEDQSFVLDFTDYESDVFNEDAPPTYNTNLNWTVVTYNSEIIHSITGEGSESDQLVFTPTADAFGSASVILQLQDTDSFAASVFLRNEPDRYIADPKSVTKAVTLVWNPVNDPPVIGSVPTQSALEDADTFTFDLASFKSDDTDSGSALSWQVSLDSTDLASVSVAGDTLTIDPAANAFGSGVLTLTLTDTDTHSNLPTSSTKEVPFVLTSVNDVPTFSSVEAVSLQSGLSNRLLSTDTAEVVALGYSDVGIVSGSVTSAAGNEYSTTTNSSVSFVQNQIGYNYSWEDVVGSSVVSTTTRIAQDSFKDTFAIDSSMEGHTVRLAVWPTDGVGGSGTTSNFEFVVNTRPDSISLASVSPNAEVFLSNQTVPLSWGAVTDPDGDDVGYRVKIWQVSGRSASPPNVNTDIPVFDSDWVTGNFTSTTNTLADGFYYWTVLTGNPFKDNTVWDSRDAVWLRNFNIDTVPPVISTSDAVLYVQSIVNSTSNVVDDSGKTRVLYGQKPNIGENYSIVLEFENVTTVNALPVVSTGSIEMVSTTNADEWTFRITYPEGDTTYNIFIVDEANNRTPYLSFLVLDDVTPPDAPVFTSPGLTLEDGVFTAVTSQNIFQLTGTKEEGVSVWLDDIALVGFTEQTSFSTLIFPEKSSGGVTALDKNDNRSVVASINIRFILGNPELQSFSTSPNLINSPSNPLISGLATDVLTSISRTQVSWVPSRDVTSYTIVDSEGDLILSGGAVSVGDSVVDTILGSHLELQEGVNTLNLRLVDEAGNIGVQSFEITRLTAIPTTNIVTEGFATFSGGRWVVDVNGVIPEYSDVSIFVGGEEQFVSTFNNGTWRYFDGDFDLENQDITLHIQDSVFNVATRNIWDNINFNNSESLFAINSVSGVILGFDSLPDFVSRLDSEGLDRGSFVTTTGLGLGTQSSAFELEMASSELEISSALESSIYQVFGRTQDERVLSQLDLAGYGVRLGLPYSTRDGVEPEKVVPVYYDSGEAEWVEYQTEYVVNDASSRVEFTIHQAGIWGLAQLSTFSTNLNELRMYPNPWKPTDGDTNTGTLASGITFDRLTDQARIRLYTVSGVMVRDMDASGLQSWVWDGRNQSGSDVFSGVYIYVITDGDEKRTGKLTIIR